MSDDAFVPPPLPVAWLAVVCTDRGQHKRTRLCDVRFQPDGTWAVAETGTPSEDDSVASWQILWPEGSEEQWLYDFFCRRCGRNPRLNRQSWLKVMDVVHPMTWPDGVSMRDLDVSRLAL